MRDLYESEDNDSDVPRYWCLGFSADGKFLATGQVNGHVKVGFPKQTIALTDRTAPDMDSLPKAC